MKLVILMLVIFLLPGCINNENHQNHQFNNIHPQLKKESVDAINSNKKFYTHQKWGDEQINFYEYSTFSKVSNNAIIIEFIDSINVTCYINNEPGCGMGTIVYDTIKWNKNKEILNLNISGTQIGGHNFNNNYDYWYYKADVYKFELVLQH